MSKKKRRLRDDPEASNEFERYERPIPSRAYILDHLGEVNIPQTQEQIFAAFDLEEADWEPLSHRLKAMVRDGQLLVNRRREYLIVDKLELLTGKVIAHRDGYGFVEVAGQSEDVFLSPRQMRGLMSGDKILLRAFQKDAKGRFEGSVVRLLERGQSHVVGRLIEREGLLLLRPSDKNFTQEISVLPSMPPAASVGKIVVVELEPSENLSSPLLGRVVEVLGDYLAPQMEIDIALRSHAIPYTWPESVQAELRDVPHEVASWEWADRVDLTDKHFVTIDGEDARDFDDAVYVEHDSQGGYRLWVAIADVSHYVAPGSALDAQALERGHSVYFPSAVIPMLPESLSNGICSLQPGVDRLVMVCECGFDAQGHRSTSRFYPGVIHSKGRLTYDQVTTWLAGECDGDSHKHLAHLQRLDALYTRLRELRVRRGALDFETTETSVVFNEASKICGIVAKHRHRAHMIIEECMLVANTCAAEFLLHAKIPGIYRVHEPPSVDKVADLQRYLGELGIQNALGEGKEPGDFARLLATIAGRQDFSMLQMVVLRSLMAAHYATDCAGHFGLAYEAYTHFTSPIRRYPDLLVHRLIKSQLAQGGQSMAWHAQGRSYPESQLAEYAHHCSMTERRADEATRDVLDWLKCEYMQDKVGEEHTGMISGVTAFGLFVTLKDVYVDGLVHISALGSEYFHFDAMRARLIGERSGLQFTLGQMIQVRVAGVSLDERKIELAYLPPQVDRDKPRKKNTRTKAKRQRANHKSRRRKA